MNNANCPHEQSTFFSATGTRNRKRLSECEDAALIDEISGIRFFGLADGQSGRTHCRQGGHEALKAVCCYIAEEGIPKLLQYEYIDDLRYRIIKRIRSRISELAAVEQTDKTELASTLVLFAYDTQTGRYVSVHLGDGGIIGHRTDGEITWISPPETGILPNCTWLTTSQDALTHVRITFGCVNSYRRLLMITDGAEAVARGRNLGDRTKSLIKDGSRDDIAAFLMQSDPADDASCIIIDF